MRQGVRVRVVEVQTIDGQVARLYAGAGAKTSEVRTLLGLAGVSWTPAGADSGQDEATDVGAMDCAAAAAVLVRYSYRLRWHPDQDPDYRPRQFGGSSIAPPS